MAEYRGYRCDKCGCILDKSELTRRTVRYVGSHAEGEYDQDLCPVCIDEVLKDSPELRPLRRRASAAKEPISA